MTDTLIMELHRNEGRDRSPMQMISADRLAYLERIEREWRLLRERVAAGVQIGTLQNGRNVGEIGAVSSLPQVD